MNRLLSKYLLYYPATLVKGEFVGIHLASYTKRQFASSEEQAVYRRERLVDILNYSVKNSKYYQSCMGGKVFDVSNVEECLLSIPTLSKSNLINDIDLIKTHRAKYSSAKTTGGSTGEPVKLFKNPDALARERAATWRAYAWAGVNIGDKQARFWGVPHGSSASREATLVDFIANRYRISAFNLSEKSLEGYYQDLLNFQPKYLYGYVSVILALTRLYRMKKYPGIGSLTSIITTSEVLTESARAEIQEVWGVKVFNEYGCGEVGSIAHECEHGRLHIMADNIHLEILGENGKPAQSGEVVVTDYFNKATPLIRYRLGDYATLRHELCPCGRTLPILESIHGRAYDLIKTPAGREVHPESLIYIFENLQKVSPAFSQFQVVQERLDRLHVYIVKTNSWNESLEDAIAETVRAQIDSTMNCKFTFVDKISRESSGKMRVVKSLI